MRRILTLAVISLGLGLCVPPAANAQDLERNITPQGGPTLRDRHCDPRRDNCRGDPDRGRARRECTPQRALAKAGRMGVRNARIGRVGRSIIDVRGRSRDGGRMMVSFGRWDRRCPVVDY